MTTVAMDIETDALDATRIWVICTEDVDTGEKLQFLNVDTDQQERTRYIELCRNVSHFVFHNGLGFDHKVINRLVEPDLIDPTKVIDTLVVSRLVDYTLDGRGHSLDAWGRRLGDHKISFKDFSALTDEMIEYCHQDVTVTVKLYNKFKSVIQDPEWQDALRCEHDIQILCEQMTANGFYFNKRKAETLLEEIHGRMSDLEASFQVDFPPILTEVNRLKYRLKDDGTPYASVTKAREKYFQTRVDYSTTPWELVCLDWVEFNPGSPKQRIDRMWDAGWEPYEKTKGHIEYEREQKRGSWR
jgi:DNA polymerase-1